MGKSWGCIGIMDKKWKLLRYSRVYVMMGAQDVRVFGMQGLRACAMI